MKTREQQLHQELLDKESRQRALVKQMDGYEQSIGLLKVRPRPTAALGAGPDRRRRALAQAKLAEQNMV